MFVCLFFGGSVDVVVKFGLGINHSRSRPTALWPEFSTLHVG